MPKEDIARATRDLLPVLQERQRSDGLAWISLDDLAAWREKYQFNKPDLGALVKVIAKEIGEEPMRLHKKPEEFVLLYKALKEQGHGEITNTIRELWKEKFPDKRIGGPSVAAVRHALGYEPSQKSNGKGDEEIPANLPPELREAMLMGRNIEKIQREVSALDGQIEELELKKAELTKQLEVYKPLMSSMKGIRSAVQSVRSAFEVRAPEGGGQ